MSLQKKSLKFIKKKLFRQWSGRPGFNPKSCHTKDFKNGT